MKRLLLLVLAVITVQLSAQDLVHYKKIVKELSSAKYQGRGYAEDGANKAGKWIAKEFAKVGADEVFCQPFKLDINTFPGKMKVSIDGKKQIPGVDFTVREFNPSIKGEFKLYYIDMLNYNPEKMFADLATPQYEGAFVVCDFMFTYKHRADFKKLQSKKECSNAGMVYTWEAPLKFYKAYGETVKEKPVIWVTPDFPKDAKSIKVCLTQNNIDESVIIATVYENEKLIKCIICENGKETALTDIGDGNNLSVMVFDSLGSIKPLTLKNQVIYGE